MTGTYCTYMDHISTMPISTSFLVSGAIRTQKPVKIYNRLDLFAKIDNFNTWHFWNWSKNFSPNFLFLFAILKTPGAFFHPPFKRPVLHFLFFFQLNPTSGSSWQCHDFVGCSWISWNEKSHKHFSCKFGICWPSSLYHLSSCQGKLKVNNLKTMPIKNSPKTGVGSIFIGFSALR